MIRVRRSEGVSGRRRRRRHGELREEKEVESGGAAARVELVGGGR